MGKSHADAMKFWTLDEFNTFIQHTTSLLYKAIFTLLFWSGIREGELLALTYNDFDFEKKLVHINKSYTRLGKKDLIGPTKTAGSQRDVTLPKHVLTLIKEFAASVYELDPTTRLFEITKYGLRSEMLRVCKNFGIQQIRIHDLRHSHASYLIERGVPILAVSKRLGHDKIETTLRTYAHLYPKKQDAIVSLMETDFNT